MKRFYLHIAFWSAYCLQDTLLAFNWIGHSLPPMSDGNLWWIALQAAILSLIPKIMLTYFILEVSIKRIISGTTSLYKIIVEIVAAFGISILLYRIVGEYIINPHVYGLFKTQKLISVSAVIVAIIDLGFVAGVAAVIKLIRMQLVVKDKQKQLVKDKLESELKFLRNQTNPHFLMNTLNNVYALARKNSPETPAVILKLSELLRYILYESGEKLIGLDKEIKILSDYLNLEMMRYNERLTVSFEKSIDKNYYQILPLLLLPFIENAFKHGISESRFESFITIDINVLNGHLSFIVENSKDAAPCIKTPKNIGLSNVTRQLELTYQDFKLDVKDNGNTFKIDLYINLKSHVEI